MQNIGKIVAVTLGGLTVHVEITDFKLSYGKKRYLVTPVSGAGTVWMQDIDLTKEIK